MALDKEREEGIILSVVVDIVHVGQNSWCATNITPTIYPLIRSNFLVPVLVTIYPFPPVTNPMILVMEILLQLCVGCNALNSRP